MLGREGESSPFCHKNKGTLNRSDRKSHCSMVGPVGSTCPVHFSKHWWWVSRKEKWVLETRYMLVVSHLAPWLNHGGIGLMGMPCTHESLGWKHGNPGSLVVQTPRAMWGGRGRARRTPRTHHGRARCAPRAGQTRTASEPDMHRVRTRWASRAHLT